MRVREVYVCNWFSRWLRRRDWMGFTLPHPFGATIFYWLIDHTDDPSPRLRKHEWTHAKQIEQDGWFRFATRYLYYLVRYGYKNNPYEVSATAAELEVRNLRLVP